MKLKLIYPDNRKANVPLRCFPDHQISNPNRASIRSLSYSGLFCLLMCQFAIWNKQLCQDIWDCYFLAWAGRNKENRNHLVFVWLKWPLRLYTYRFSCLLISLKRKRQMCSCWCYNQHENFVANWTGKLPVVSQMFYSWLIYGWTFPSYRKLYATTISFQILLLLLSSQWSYLDKFTLIFVLNYAYNILAFSSIVCSSFPSRY